MCRQPRYVSPLSPSLTHVASLLRVGGAPAANTNSMYVCVFVYLQSALLLSSVAFVIVNAMTLWVFVARPFTAPDGSTGRFMW